jgi:hypothetical protein
LRPCNARRRWPRSPGPWRRASPRARPVSSNTNPQSPRPSLRAQRSNPEPAPWSLDCFVGFASSQRRVRDLRVGIRNLTRLRRVSFVSA